MKGGEFQINMSTMKTPPVFSSKRSYERYRAELTAWSEVTSVKKASWARIIAFNMPDTPDEGDIRGKIFESLGDELAGEEGYPKLLSWLDKHFKRDQDLVMIDSIKQFMKFKKTEDMTISEFLAGFDTAYNTAVKKGLDKLPQPYLMFMIVENAGLSEQEIKFVLSDIDKEQKDTLYEQTRSAMKKYLIGLNSDSKESASAVFKPEASVMYMNSRGRPIRPEAGSWRPRVPQYIPSNPIRRGGYQPGFSQTAFRGARPKIAVPVPRNPMKEGKTMLCDLCGAFTHLQAKCPHNPNTKAYIAENWDGLNKYYDENETQADQSAVVYGDSEFQEWENDQAYDQAENIANMFGSTNEQEQLYSLLETLTVINVYENDMEEVSKHGLMDEVGTVVIDTGCIKTVTGQAWYDSFVSSLDTNTRKMISIKKSENIFKFGGGTRKKSVGLFSIPCSIMGKNIILVTDVVEQDDLPCLLSKDSLKRAGAKINVAEDQIEIFGQSLKLRNNRSGHYVLQLEDFVHTSQPFNEFKVLWQILDGEC